MPIDLEGNSSALAIFNAPFVAEIAAVTGSSPYVYSWKEKTLDTAGTSYIDATSGRAGDATNQPMYEMNDALLAVGDFVYAKVRGIQGGKLVYECDAGRGVTVKESDGSPSYGSILKIEFDQATGFVVTQPGTGRAKVSGGVTVKESDGSPSYASVATIEFDQAAGFVVTQPAANQAKVSFSGSSGITVKESDGSPSYSSTTSLELDQDAGFVVTQPGANRAKVSFAFTVKESDGSPSYSPVTSLEFDQSTGFILSQPGTGRVKVALPSYLLSGTGGWIHGTGLVDGGGISGVATQNGDTINLSDTGVTPGTYTFGTKSVTVDAQGRITNIV